MVIFKNREAAGKLLGERLINYKETRDAIVLGIPRGGVVVAAEVSKVLKLPLDIVITRKIGAPSQKELALGAIDPDGEIFWEEQIIKDLGIKSRELLDEADEQLKEIERREKLYRGNKRSFSANKKALSFKGKTIILVDDGIATGATIISAIKYILRKKAQKIILAVPVATKDIIDKIPEEVLEIIVLTMPESLGSVGRFYKEFDEVSDKKVVELIHR
jgi:putative phosphoribosyl transferase